MATFAAVEAESPKTPSSGNRRSLRIFLSGPITGLSYQGASDWRVRVRSRLETEVPGAECDDPLRGRPHLAEVVRIDTDSHRHGSLNGQAAVARDLWDVDRCDVLLMNLTGTREVSIGSMVELGRATSKGKFVIVVLPTDELADKAGANRNPHDHLFIHELASVVVDSIDDAVELVSTL